jgi:predicted DNA-binding transcriptional regulator AlpA
MKLSEIWGVKQVSNATGLGRKTVHTLKSYGRLPNPDLVRSGRPFWTRATIKAWCAGKAPDKNGRIATRPFDEDYEAGLDDE